MKIGQKLLDEKGYKRTKGAKGTDYFFRIHQSDYI